MMIQYFTVDGRCVIEKANVNARYIEMRDGYHPITNDSVWQDSKRLKPPVMAIFEGVLGPLGSDMSVQDVKGILLEVQIIKRSHKTQSISKMWMRALARVFEFVYTRGIPIGIIIFALYFVGSAMLKGA
jgi:hypothetical protein